MDVDSIEPGLDFGEAIDRAVRSCGVMLVLIGDEWLTSTDKYGRRRLDNPDDYVRLEIEATLNKVVRVIPVLVGGRYDAQFPGTPSHPGVAVTPQRPGSGSSRFDDDASRLIDTIQRALNTTPG